MKITLSKSQWEAMGKKAACMKTFETPEQVVERLWKIEQSVPFINVENDILNAEENGQWDAFPEWVPDEISQCAKKYRSLNKTPMIF